MAKYLSAKKLGILPEERKALIAFVTKPAKGQVISLNGRKHYYDQRSPSISFDKDSAVHTCGTAGCVAGYVFAHARYIQGKRTLRGAKTANRYIDEAWGEYWKRRTGEHLPNCDFLNELYSAGDRKTASKARKVVARALATGIVKW